MSFQSLKHNKGYFLVHVNSSKKDRKHASGSLKRILTR